MSLTHKPSIMEQLFGHHVPWWQKVLTLVTFPLWGPIVVLGLACMGFFMLMVVALDVATTVLDNITDR